MSSTNNLLENTGFIRIRATGDKITLPMLKDTPSILTAGNTLVVSADGEEFILSPLDSADLGTFTGDIIEDNCAVKDALQALETSMDGLETYTHPTSAGNKHVPAGGAADQVLTYDSAGTAVWAAAAPGVPSRVNAVMNTLRVVSAYNYTMREQLNMFVDEFADESDTDAAETTAIYSGQNDSYDNASISVAEQTLPYYPSTQKLGNDGGTYVDQVSQGFQLATGQTISSAIIKYYYLTGSPGSIEMRIETDNAGEPSGTLADPGLTVDIGAPTSWTEVKGWFTTPGALLASTQYHLVLKLASDPGTGNNVSMYGQSYDLYANGIAAYRTGGAWAAMTGTVDLFFGVFYQNASAQVQTDAHTASASTGRGILIAWAALGTGTIVYSISRDGGTTFTAATMTTLGAETGSILQYYSNVDISAQPAGTSMKIRATITGDATLYGWGLDYNA
jgi:hypothetical protein